MWAFLQHLSFWDWLALGTVLLILEVFGAGGYLLWIGMAAAAVGVLTFFLPGLSWEWQFLLFGLLSIVHRVVLVATSAHGDASQRSAAPESARPGTDRQNLRGACSDCRRSRQIKVADGVWMARGPDTAIGGRVRVVGQQGAILLVEAAE